MRDEESDVDTESAPLLEGRSSPKRRRATQRGSTCLWHAFMLGVGTALGFCAARFASDLGTSSAASASALGAASTAPGAATTSAPAPARQGADRPDLVERAIQPRALARPPSPCVPDYMGRGCPASAHQSTPQPAEEERQLRQRPKARARAAATRPSPPDIDARRWKHILNESLDWSVAAVPLFEAEDDDVTTTYWYRWRLFHLHLQRGPRARGCADTKKGCMVLTEFLQKARTPSRLPESLTARPRPPPLPVGPRRQVFWSGPANTIVCPAGHHIMEGRWLHSI